MVLYLRCVGGLSFRAIGRSCQRDVHTVYEHYKHALAALACYDEAGNPNAPGIMRLERILAMWTRDATLGARTTSQAVDELQSLTIAKAREFDLVAECMEADGSTQRRSAIPEWQLWEARYLNSTGRTSIPNSAYDACRAVRYCDAE